MDCEFDMPDLVREKSSIAGDCQERAQRFRLELSFIPADRQVYIEPRDPTRHSVSELFRAFVL